MRVLELSNAGIRNEKHLTTEAQRKALCDLCVSVVRCFFEF